MPLGALTGDQIPFAVAPLVGTNNSIELARKTVTNGAVSFDLDLAALTKFMTTSSSPTHPWNGTLVLWLAAANNTSASVTNVQLSTVAVIDYPNRDTGRSGAPVGSRVSRCPVLGTAISRGQMVVDGWRGIKVHPDAYDPAEPDQPDFVDYPEED
jgi:hypothetical protein